MDAPRIACKHYTSLQNISGTNTLAFLPQCWQQALMLKPFFFITDAPKKYLTVFHSYCRLLAVHANIRPTYKTFLLTIALAFLPQCWQQVLMLKPFFFVTDALAK